MCICRRVWDTIFELSLCLCFVSACGVCFAAFDVSDNGVWDVCLV